MPSGLREQISFQSFNAVETVRISTSSSPPPQKKQKMSLSQTYFIASSARSKLGKEATKPDHNLRLLVGHANLLDSLMIELRDAEREQEAWFNASVQRAEKPEEPRHIQWIDTIAEEEDEESDSDNDSDSDFDEEEFQMAVPLRRLRSPPITISSEEVDSEDEEDEDMYQDFEYSSELALTRTHSHPPELIHDSESDDDTPPASPPQPNFEYNEKEAAADLALLSQGKFDQSDLVHLIPESAATLIEAY